MKQVLSRLQVVIIFFLKVVSVHSQSNYLIQHYTNENGLPANGIKGIELDKKTGFLWVGTQAGLTRFDGKHFVSFSSPKNTIAASRITFIAKNREGTIYCEDDNYSVYRIVKNKPEFVMTDTCLVDPYLIPVSTSAIVQQLQKHQRSSFLPNWMLFHDELADTNSFSILHLGRAWHYNAARDTLLGFNGNFQQILKLGGHLYFVDEDLGFYTYNESRSNLVPVAIENMPVWSNKGNEKPQFIWKPGMKDPLLIFNRNIWQLQRAGNTIKLQPFCQQCCPEDAYIYNAQIWEERGIIFLGSEKNGLYVIRTPFLRTIRTDTIIKSGRAEYAQAEITPGMITTGYDVSFSVQDNSLYRKGEMEFHPWAIYRDQHGDHWFHSKDTIIHLHKEDGHRTKMPPIGSGITKMIFAETQNRLFVITEMVIAEITGERYQMLFKISDSPEGLRTSLNPDDAIEWKPGILAIATEKLVLFDTKKGTALDTIAIPGLTAKVRTLWKHGDYLLIGTYGQGFYIYKNGVVKKMPLDKNGYLNYAHCFMPDAQGFCWISTNHGLFKASINALITAYENDLPEIYYHYFGKDDGIFNTEFNGGCQPCAIKLSTGLFSFPSMNGIVVLDPQQQHPPPPAGNIFIEEIVVDSASYEPGNNSLHALSHRLRNIRFKLALPQFGNSENIYFSYKLEPYNDEWETQDILQNNTLQFGGLKPGDYKLYLRVRNGFEPDQFGTTVLEFRILKPWYQSEWFYVFCVLGFAALVAGLVKWRTASITKRRKELQKLVDIQTESIAIQSRQLENQLIQLQSQQTRLEEDNKIKARLIAIISHDMINPLKFMTYMSKKLRDTFSPADPAYGNADAMVISMRELESLSLNMLNWIRFHYEPHKMRPAWFNLHELVNESTEIISRLANEKGLKLYNDVSPVASVWQYRQAIGVIVYNLTMNAMKYTDAGEIRITSLSSHDHFSVSIADTGKGMLPELVDQLNSGELFIADYSAGEMKKFQFGYSIIKDLLQLTQGRMKVESVLDKGTLVTIEFLSMKEKTDN